MSYSYNSSAKYRPSDGYDAVITASELTRLKIIVQDDGEKSAGFDVKFNIDLFSASAYRYMKHGDPYDAGGFESARSAYNKDHSPLSLWDTQLNFATHCATSALGVSSQHLNSRFELVKSLYRFHTYYHIRRILDRMMCPLPYDDKFDKYNNYVSKEDAKKIANEYGVSDDFKKYSGRYYFWKDSHTSWSKWIMNDSSGFTKQGLVKISESIRLFTYLILSSQAAARHEILGNGADAATAQRLFQNNFDDVVQRKLSLQEDIERYQNTLKYASSLLDYSVGDQLYMLPSDMLLKPLNEVIDGYNDKIVINRTGIKIGRKPVVKQTHLKKSVVKVDTNSVDEHSGDGEVVHTADHSVVRKIEKKTIEEDYENYSIIAALLAVSLFFAVKKF